MPLKLLSKLRIPSPADPIVGASNDASATGIVDARAKSGATMGWLAAPKVIGASVLLWLVTLYFFVLAAGGKGEEWNGFWVLVRDHEPPAAWAGVGVLVAAGALYRPFMRCDWERLAVWIERYLVGLCAVALVIYAALAVGAFQRFPMSTDEYGVWSESHVFAAGQLSGWVPPPLLDWILPWWTKGEFFAVSQSSGHFTASYWPGLAISQIPFTLLGVTWLCNPVWGALGLWGVFRLAKRLTGSSEAAAWAWVLTLCSPVIAINAASFYAMPAHFTCGVFYALSLLRDDRWSAFWAGVLGRFRVDAAQSSAASGVRVALGGYGGMEAARVADAIGVGLPDFCAGIGSGLERLSGQLRCQQLCQNRARGQRVIALRRNAGPSGNGGALADALHRAGPPDRNRQNHGVGGAGIAGFGVVWLAYFVAARGRSTRSARGTPIKFRPARPAIVGNFAIFDVFDLLAGAVRSRVWLGVPLRAFGVVRFGHVGWHRSGERAAWGRVARVFRGAVRAQPDGDVAAARVSSRKPHRPPSGATASGARNGARFHHLCGRGAWLVLVGSGEKRPVFCATKIGVYSVTVPRPTRSWRANIWSIPSASNTASGAKSGVGSALRHPPFPPPSRRH